MCGKERNFLRCDDVPIVFTDVIDDNLLSYNHGSRFLTVDFQPEKICMVPESGRIYHPGPEKAGGIGLLADKLGIEWTAVRYLIHNINTTLFLATLSRRKSGLFLPMEKKIHRQNLYGTIKIYF